MANNSAKKVHALMPGSAAPQQTPSGIRLLLDKANDVDYSKLPMLEGVCDKFATLATDAMRKYMSDAVNIKAMEITSIKFGDYMRSCSHSIVSVFKATTLHSIGLMTVESRLAHNMIDLLCGGRQAFASSSVDASEMRVFTPIEIGVARNVAEILLLELNNSFEQAVPLTFTLERVEISHNVLTLLQPGDDVVVCKLEVSLEQQSGHLAVLLPHRTIAPMRKLLSKQYTGNQVSKDPAWANHMEQQIACSKVKVEVMLNGGKIAFSKVAELKVGQTIVLDKPSDSPCNLLLNGNVIGSVALGCIGDNIAVTVLSDGIKVISGSK